MKTLIVYASNHGCTESIAKEMKNNLGENAVLINLKRNKLHSVEEFHRVIIGGSIHAGQIQKQIKQFCSENLNALLLKETGLFICCIEQGEAADKQLTDAFPAKLLNSAKSTAIFRGKFDFSRMNFIERMMVRKVSGVKQNTSKIDFEAVRQFSRRMDRVFNPFLFLA
jgi:menaquinone-dependent protoporphyrinogen oxidase